MNMLVDPFLNFSHFPVAAATSSPAPIVRVAVVLSLIAALSISAPARAECVGGDGSYDCSGAFTTTQTLSGSPLNITLDDTFLISVANGEALRLTGTGGVSLTQTGSGAITAGGTSYGIQVTNQTSGDFSITTTGNISGYSGMALHPQAGTGNVTVNSTGNLSATVGTGLYMVGAASGLYNINLGAVTSGTLGSAIFLSASSGAGMSITTGTLTGLNGHSLFSSYAGTGNHTVMVNGDATRTGDGSSVIVAHSAETSNDLSITVNGNVNGGGGGIQAFNSSTTDKTTVVVTGSITAGKFYGVNAISSGSGVTVNTGAVTANTFGIAALNFGSGDVSVTTAGDVTASTSRGILAWNTEATGGNVTVTANGNVTGGAGNAVYAENDGTGDTTITMNGTVTGGNGADAAIIAYNSASTGGALHIQAATVTGNADGIVAFNNGTGATSVATSGTVTGTTGVGIDVFHSGATGILTITQTGGEVSGGAAGIKAVNLGVGPTIVSTSGKIVGGVYGLLTSTRADSLVSINLNSGASVSATSGVAILDTFGNATVTMASGAKLTGQVLLGDGNDTMIVNGTADLSGATLIDGGNSLDGTVTDVFGTPSAATNKFTFQGSTQSITGSILKNWQTVSLNGANVNLADGTLVTGTGSNADISAQGLQLGSGSTLTSPVALAVTGDVDIDATSSLQHALGGSITGNVTNAGMIYWGNLGQTLTINGNYTGVAGSHISLETYLGDDTSVTDMLHITGNTSGVTAITVRPIVGSPGANTTNGILLVQVDGTSAADNFILAAPVQAGAYQYILSQGSSLDANDWYLVNHYDCTLNNCPSSATPIYRPGITNYVSGQAANAEQGLLQLSSLHQRMGERHGVDTEGRQAWLRPYSNKQGSRGRTQFGYKASTIGLQLGKELLVRQYQCITDRIALTLDYANSNADFTNRLRPLAGLSANTGSMDAQSVGIGATYTRMDRAGGYLDVAGQLSTLRNKFNDSYGTHSRQNGRRTGLSIEAGKPVAQLGHWKIEPQGQLTWLHTVYDSFTDSAAHIGGDNANRVQSRIGVRVFKLNGCGKDATSPLYGIVNLIHDFTRSSPVDIGGASVSEEFSRTRAEIGIGAQGQISKANYLYADTRYQHSIDAPMSEMLQLNLGIKMEF